MVSNSKSNPMEMAASAKDKIQASARELIKNLEDAVQAKRQNPENALKEGASSIEAALRAMFSSCTSPSNVVNTSESVEERKSSKSSHNKELPRKKSEKSLTSSNKKDLAPVTQQKDIGDHIYAQLFFDDQIRAAKAVNSLRDQEGKALTKPFPASSPVTPPMKTQEVTPLDISANLTFDDSISAISAHTLEALARTSRSDLTDHDAHGSNPLPDPTERRDTLGAASSPFIASFPRTQSSQTNKSGFSKESKQSHSTRTTESSSFDAWQREENKFWNKEVKQVERSPRRSHRSRSDSVRSKTFDASFSKVSGQIGGSPNRHPHDTFDFDAFADYEEEPVALVDTSEMVAARRSREKLNQVFSPLAHNVLGEI